MKQNLTIEQSAELIRNGVPNNRASDFEAVSSTNPWGIGGQVVMARPIFTLADLLSLIPKTINNGNHYLDLSYGFGDWTASYILWDSRDEGTYIEDTQGEKTAKELVDALYELLLWCLDNHVKLDRGWKRNTADT